MARVIAVANQKGGVAKTTTTAAMASAIKLLTGKKVLVVDLDPQGNLSQGVGADMYEYVTIYDVLMKKSTAEEAVQQLKHFDVIPSNITLAGVEQELQVIGKEVRLKEALSPITKKYDYILFDTPPSLGLLTVNALSAADEILIPSTAGIFSAKGINQLSEIIESVKGYFNKKVRVAGIVITRYDPRPVNSRNLVDLTLQLGEMIKVKVFSTRIRSSVVVEEAQTNGIDLFEHAGTSTVANDYMDFAKEYLEITA